MTHAPPPDKLVPVEAWAAARYTPTPSSWVLRRWCRDGEVPGAERVGRAWFVPEHATRAHSRPSSR